MPRTAPESLDTDIALLVSTEGTATNEAVAAAAEAPAG